MHEPQPIRRKRLPLLFILAWLVVWVGPADARKANPAGGEPPYIQLNAAPNPFPSGTQVQLIWDVSSLGAGRCDYSTSDGHVAGSDAFGNGGEFNYVFHPGATQTFTWTVTCQNNIGQSSQSLLVTLNPGPPPPPPPPPPPEEAPYIQLNAAPNPFPSGTHVQLIWDVSSLSAGSCDYSTSDGHVAGSDAFGNGGEFNYVFHPGATQTFTWTVTCQNNIGQSSQSLLVSLDPNPPPPPPPPPPEDAPLVVLGASPNPFVLGQAVELTWEVFSPSGGQCQYETSDGWIEGNEAFGPGSERHTFDRVPTQRFTWSIRCTNQAGEALKSVFVSGPPFWHLDRIDQRNLPLDLQPFTPFASGSGVRIYVLDTGVRLDHGEFSGRMASGVTCGYDVCKPGGADCAGHGTQVAGVAAGATHGVATEATIVPVRASTCDGGHDPRRVRSAIAWITGDYPNYREQGISGVVTMSLTLGSLDNVNALAAKASRDSNQIAWIVAAADAGIGQDACVSDPWAVDVFDEAVLVSASERAPDRVDQRAAFADYGPCVDLYAPGVDIETASLSNYPFEFETVDGTSFAAPQVAGLAALYLQLHPLAPAFEVEEFLTRHATPGVVRCNQAGCPQGSLLYVGG